MLFILIILLIILMILTIRIKIEIRNFKFTSQSKEHMNKNYKINLKIYVFYIVPIFRITQKKIKELFKSEKVKEQIKKQEFKIKENNINIKKIKDIKNLKLDIDKMDLKVMIGTENASITAFTVSILSALIAVIFSKQNKIINNNYKYIIEPIYINENLINLEISGIFQIKMIHIINTICLFMKKNKGNMVAKRKCNC